MNLIRKLKNRKGFTIVELIIVIAIIGVLLAMVLPGLLGSNMDTKGKGYAKEFFYKTQDFMSRRRVADNPSSPVLNSVVSNNHFIVYAESNPNDGITDTGIITYRNGGTYSASDKITRAAITSSGSYTSDFKEFMSKFENDLKSYVVDAEYNCTYYALVDNEFRVQTAYWTDCSWDDIVDGNGDLSFTDDYITGGYYSCSYPVIRCSAGEKMFVY